MRPGRTAFAGSLHRHSRPPSRLLGFQCEPCDTRWQKGTDKDKAFVVSPYQLLPFCYDETARRALQRWTTTMCAVEELIKVLSRLAGSGRGAGREPQDSHIGKLQCGNYISYINAKGIT